MLVCGFDKSEKKNIYIYTISANKCFDANPDTVIIWYYLILDRVLDVIENKPVLSLVNGH